MKPLLKDILVLLVALIVAGGAWYLSARISSAPAAPATPIASVSYACADGKAVHADYYEGSSAPSASSDMPPVPTGSAVVTLDDGSVMTLPQTISADGARYANADESFVFWSKGTGAFITQNGEETYSDCVQQ